MHASLVIQLSGSSNATLNQISKHQNRPSKQVAEELLEKALAVAQIRQLRKQMQPQAQKAGYKTENDILNSIS